MSQSSDGAHSARPNNRTWQEELTDFLPQAMRLFGAYFRAYQPEAKEELIQESVCNLAVMFKRAADNGKLWQLSYNAVVWFAHLHTLMGRGIGHKGSRADSSRCLMTREPDLRQWGGEWALADGRATPPEIVQPKLDWKAYFATLPTVRQRVAMMALRGETTGAIAKQLGLSVTHISRLRRKLVEDYQEFTE